MKIGIVGATGQVGGVMRRILSERAFPYPSPVRTYVAEHQAGEGT